MSTIRDLQGTYVLDASHSSLAFIARHAMVTKVRGSFSAFTGEATINGAEPAASSLKVVVDVASVNTNDAGRDGHLKSADFFDVETYPTITFVGTGFDIVDDSTVEVTGDLTIKDVTRSVAIPFEFTGEAKDPFGNTRIGFEGRVDVSRKDFGLTWNAVLETGGVLVSDKIVLEFDVSAIKQA
ncbi:YceI family protein [Propioniciclava tarda]|uniref:Polyisoprenoid-binding protein n=1 Tax=Propioniciclava tarda TaxID=433330 RepID=A0A4Q9KMK4_PROTD|nr:YceI family protein [Propioniciclava tarda]TBT95455.1 polyisoprenoid-binding protein [Propioniciclava tarda]SMO49627.1 Polyisoprenoid-binding protein YceI [Propioniciclava tarda]